MSNCLALGFPQGGEWLVILALGLLIFGNRLPEVGRNFGKGIFEFRKGLKEASEGMEEHTGTLPPGNAPAHKFDPYTGKPLTPPLPPGAKFDPYTGKPLDTQTAPRNN